MSGSLRNRGFNIYATQKGGPPFLPSRAKAFFQPIFDLSKIFHTKCHHQHLEGHITSYRF